MENVKEKVTLDLSYSDETKPLYDSFISKLQKEGWKLENTFIDQRKGKGNFYYRTMVRRVVK